MLVDAQFYSWYFHTLPLLLWHCTDLPVPLKLVILGGIEYAFNVYPATAKSSTVLQVIDGTHRCRGRMKWLVLLDTVVTFRDICMTLRCATLSYYKGFGKPRFLICTMRTAGAKQEKGNNIDLS